MISICIPVYNFNAGELVEKLFEQSKFIEVPSEIILIDDCSEEIFRNQYKDIPKTVKYIQLKKNIGRAAIRNLFLKYTNQDHMLFLDCDSLIIKDNFLQKYIDSINKHPDSVICGGRLYDSEPPVRDKMLRWKYGIVKESKSLEARSEHPYRSFMTNNFVVNRNTFESIQFDERLLDYGHEDTLFGFELKNRGVEIIHIDNPVLNGHLEENIRYIQNTEKAVGNLIFLLEYTQFNKDLIEDVTLLRTFYRLHKVRGIIRIIFLLVSPLIRYFLLKGYISLPLFNFYKLGMLTVKMNFTNHRIPY